MSNPNAETLKLLAHSLEYQNIELENKVIENIIHTLKGLAKNIDKLEEEIKNKPDF